MDKHPCVTTRECLHILSHDTQIHFQCYKKVTKPKQPILFLLLERRQNKNKIQADKFEATELFSRKWNIFYKSF